ncbi:cytochrome c oxidase assembly protein [Rhizobium sp. Leaf311]|uniref:cytochrome c oxidase assembly protein n=1 Tax=Rhizobium sp. Leaf311 TaxID=1736332 RepID=UPI0007877C57|nr:cytochrome c oxidase assembly protein [Rhizobium sp. Leaf311]
MPSTLDPYCGPAPDSQDLQYAWNLDPVLVLAMVSVIAVLHARSDDRHRGLTVLLSLVLVIAFVSPLCALSTALFSARTIHHILVGSVAAPIAAALLLATPMKALKVPAEAVFLFHTVVYWTWHLPFAYDFALSGALPYWLMQAALIGSSVWLWLRILSEKTSMLSSVGLAVGTMVQMGFLGAILTFAPQPLFAPHLLTTQVFGFTPLGDQQLSGVLMWTLGFAPYAAAAVFVLRKRLFCGHQALGN